LKLFRYVLRFIKRIAKTILPRKTYEKWDKLAYRKYLQLHMKVKSINLYFFRKLQRGVNLFVHCTENSAGTIGRLLQQTMETTGIPYQIIDLNNLIKYRKEQKNIKLYRTNIIHSHVSFDISITLLKFYINIKKHYNIAYCAWELADLPDAFCSLLDYFQEVWTPSTFCTNSIGRKSYIPVLTVPHTLDTNRTVIENGREYFKIDKDIFLFMFAYDCGSYVARKNPNAAVQAFMKAFSPDDRHVGMMLKLIYSKENKEQDKEHIKKLMETLSLYPHIYYIDRYLSDEEMRTLLNVSDTFVTLHRSEGFGLFPLEAMALGTPVISTAWSGNMEYMNYNNAALVDYKLIPVNGEYVGSIPGDGYVWADPDIDEAAAYMRRLVSDIAWRESLIKNGKHTAEEFNTASTAKLIRKRLEFLKLI